MSKQLPVQLVQQGRDPVHRSVAPLVRAYLRVHPAERARPVGGAGGAGGVRDGAAAVVGLEEVGAVPQEHVRHPRVLQEDGVEQGGPAAAVPDVGVRPVAPDERQPDEAEELRHVLVLWVDADAVVEGGVPGDVD